MRVVRFMSAAEAIKLLNGETIENRTNHRNDGWNSDAVGFCFAVDNAKRSAKEAVYQAAGWLSGISTMHVALHGYTDAEWSRSETWGGFGKKEEASTTSYSLSDFSTYRFYAPSGVSVHDPFKFISSQNYKKATSIAGGDNL